MSLDNSLVEGQFFGDIGEEQDNIPSWATDAANPVKTEQVTFVDSNSDAIERLHAGSVRLIGDNTPRIAIAPNNIFSDEEKAEYGIKQRIHATIDQVVLGDHARNKAGLPYDWAKENTPEPYSLKNGAVSTAKSIDNAVAKISRGIVRTPEGEDTGQWILATPYRVKENFDNRNFGPLVRQAATAVVASAVVMSAIPEKSANIEFDATPFTRTEHGVVAYFDTKDQDIELSARVAELAIGADNGSVVIDTGSQTIHFNDQGISDSEVVAGIVAASAPDNKQALKQAPTKSPEEMNDQEYMQYLVDSASVSVDEYNSFEVNTDYEDVFKDELSGNRIKPTKFVAHWTAVNYKDGVDGFIRGIKGRDGNCCSSMYFIPEDGSKTYRFADSWEQMAHAYGANSFTQGVEIEAEGLRGLSPKQMKQLIMTAKRFMDANDISIARDNFVGHMEIDEEFGNHQKIDMPPELMDGLFTKLKELDDKISGQTKIEVQDSIPEGMTPQQAFEYFTNKLLDEIAAHEGGWNSVNTGKAGDTKYGGDKYNNLFGGRDLSELTLQEVLDMQAADKLFAVGRYQFIPGTLSSAVKHTAVDTSALFNEETQNQLAVDYLLLGGKRANLRDFLLGESDDIESAVQDLCKEWASMPCNNGQGYYDGDSAGNSAAGGKKRLEEIKQIIAGIREASIAKNNLVTNNAAETTSGGEKAAELRKVVMLGDSLTVGMNDTGSIRNIDEQYGLEVVNVDARVGRALVGGKDNGLESIERLKDTIAESDVVYFGYGTNPIESTEMFEQGMQTAVERISQINPSVQIVIPRIYSGIGSKDDRNAIIESYASHGNIEVIDVSNAIELSNDGIHPRQYQDVAKLVAQHISELSNEKNDMQVAETTTTEELNIDNTNEKEYSIWLDKDLAEQAYRAFFVDGDSFDEDGLEEWINSLPERNNEVLVNTNALPTR